MNNIIIYIIISIILIQFYIFIKKTLPSIQTYKKSFELSLNGLTIKKGIIYTRPTSLGTYENINDPNAIQIETSKETRNLPILSSIIDAINKYLKENSNRASDFSLIKDIVDRNVDAAEEEARELLPIPLYLGLAGTMIGIAFGVGALDIEEIFSADNVNPKLIAPLLNDVATAMICSIIGVALTTAGTLSMRSSKAKVEESKHSFLSWIQVNILPEMPDNMTSVVRRMASELTDFNRSFEINSRNLNLVLQRINETARSNADLIQAVKDLDQVSIATTNINLYNRLANCTKEIGTLAQYLENCSSYLEHVKALNDKLDDSEGRIKAIEDMATFFREEKARIDVVSKLTTTSIGQSEEAVRQSIEVFKENIQNYFSQMQDALVQQTNRMGEVFKEQQDALTKKAGEVSQLVSELKNLQDIKKTMTRLLEAYQEQNQLLTASLNARKNKGEDPVIPIEQPPIKLPSWLAGVIAIAALALIAMAFLTFATHFHWFKL